MWLLCPSGVDEDSHSSSRTSGTWVVCRNGGKAGLFLQIGFLTIPNQRRCMFCWMVATQICFLNFHPETWGKINPFWLAYVSDGLVQPPTSLDAIIHSWKTCRLMTNVQCPLKRLNYTTTQRNSDDVFFKPTRFPKKHGWSSPGRFLWHKPSMLNRGVKNLKPQLLRDAAGQHVVFLPRQMLPSKMQRNTRAQAACWGSWSVGEGLLELNSGWNSDIPWVDLWPL